MANRLRNYLAKFNLLYDHQFGFRPGYSTSMALLDSIDSILENFEQGNKVAGIFIDLSKAFDSLDHSILLNKIANFGIRGIIFNWLKSYLEDRQQFTSYNNFSSSIRNISFGVPQGSVLGPLLFLLYINDIGNIPNINCLPNLFADDANIFIHGKNYEDLNVTCQNTLNLIVNWISANRLTLNIDKTCYMLFSPALSEPSPNNFQLTISNSCIKKVENTKFLGVWLDSRLNWKFHIQDLYNSLIKFVGIFYKLKSFLPPHILKLLYYSLIHPIIIIIWHRSLCKHVPILFT